MTIIMIILTFYICLDKESHDNNYDNADTFYVLIGRAMAIIMIMLTLSLS